MEKEETGDRVVEMEWVCRVESASENGSGDLDRLIHHAPFLYMLCCPNRAYLRDSSNVAAVKADGCAARFAEALRHR